MTHSAESVASEPELVRCGTGLAEGTPMLEGGRTLFVATDDLRDLPRIVGGDVDPFPGVLMPVVDRLLEGSIRALALELEAVAPGVGVDAAATLFLGAPVHVRVVEAIGVRRPGAVEQVRLVGASACLSGLLVEKRT